MVINHNISALNTLNKLNANTTSAQSSLEKLSSGLRINKAGDDAAGLAISQKMQAQINGLNQASSNAQDGISLIQTAEGGMNQVQTILQRMNTLATQSANGTQDGDGGTDRTALNTEFQSLTKEIDRIANSTQFNGMNLINGGLAETATADATLTSSLVFGSKVGTTLDGSLAGGNTWTISAATQNADNTISITVTGTVNGASTPYTLKSNVATFSAANTLDKEQPLTFTDGKGHSLSLSVKAGTTMADLDQTVTVSNSNTLNLQVGANNTINDRENIMVGDMRITGGTDGQMTALATADISSATNARAALDTVKSAIDDVSAQRANLGAYQNRLNYTISNLSTESQNLSSASSQITDVDMAKEMTEFTKNNILTQAAQAMLAQANQLPQGVLSLLK